MNMEPLPHDEIPRTTNVVETVKPVISEMSTEATPNYMRMYGVYAIVGVAALLVAMVVFSYIASSSLPDGRLYSFKTNVVERIIGYTKIGVGSHASYNIILLEARLAELQTLSRDQATTSPDTLVGVARRIDSYTNDILASLNDSGAVGTTEHVDILLRLASVTNAEDTLIDDTDEFAPMKESIKVSRGAVTDTLKSAVQTFASSSSPEIVGEYIGSHIEAVIADIPKLAQGSRAQKLAIARVNDMNESMIDGNTADALIFILRARQAIAVDAYLFDAERGLTDTAPVVTTEVPEGN